MKYLFRLLNFINNQFRVIIIIIALIHLVFSWLNHQILIDIDNYTGGIAYYADEVETTNNKLEHISRNISGIHTELEYIERNTR